MSKIVLMFLLGGVTTILCQKSNGWDWHEVDPFFVTSRKPPTPTPPTTKLPITTNKLPNTPTTSMRPTSGPLSKEQRKCIRKCPSTSEYNPICGTDNNTYDNEGKLFCAKTCGIATEKSYEGVCSPQPVTTSTTSSSSSATPSPDCFKRCPKTSEYNPLCGSDSRTYDNPSRLTCTQQCGANVRKVSNGPCVGRPSIMTPLPLVTTTTTLSPSFRTCQRKCTASAQYLPVCGSDGRTYTNDLDLQCEISCGRGLRKVKNGEC